MPDQNQPQQPGQQPVQPAQSATPAQPVVQQSTPQQPVAPAQPVVQQPVQQQMPQQTAQKPQPAGTGPVRPIAPGQPGAGIPPKPLSVKKKKQIITGVIATLGCGFFLFVAVIFWFLTQAETAGDNPLLELFGVSEENFIPLLITLTNLVFGLLEFVVFIIAIIGLFRIAMAKKEDKDSRRKGTIMAFIGGMLLVIFAVIWIFVYLYLDARRVDVVQAGPSGIITTPEETTGLTAPMTIAFDASQLPIDERLYEVLSYSWDFGDGASSTGPTVSHNYTQKGPDAGRYTVTLTIAYRDIKTDEEGTDTQTVDVVFENEKVNASFTASPTAGEAPLTVTFDASESLDPDGEIMEYLWDLDGDDNFDDGTGESVEYTYTQNGTYTAQLKVVDNTNDYDIAEQEIVVAEEGKPKAVIEVDNVTDNTFYAGENYTFTGASSSSPNGNIQSYEWTWSDGAQPIKTRTATRSFDATGTYEVTLSVTDKTGETGETTLTVTVVNPESIPTAVITVTPDFTDEKARTLSCEVPCKVAFSAETSTDSDNNIVEYSWDFDGDDVSDAAAATANYTYQESGTYLATLTVTDAENNVSSDTVTIEVSSQGLQASLTVDQVEGEVPLTVDFDASGSSYQDGTIVSYVWNFGDGSAERIDTASVSYRYTTVGTYTATVTAVGSDGNEDTASINITVRPVSVQACFTTNASSGAAPLTVTFDPSCSTGTITRYYWDFSGSTSRDRKPSYTFQNPGNYTVTLEVSDNANIVDTYSTTIAVTGEAE